MGILIGRIFKRLGKEGILNFIDDETYLKILFRLFMNRSLDLKNPKTLNEKIQWLKLYDRKGKYISMVDKISAKDYVDSIIGKEYIVPTLGVWNRVEDINLDDLPSQFVLKCSHDSGSVVICKNKNVFDFSSAKKYLKNKLSYNYSYAGREWVYKYIQPRIIAEKYLSDPGAHELNDYKFYCFGSYVDCVLVCTNRESGNPEFYFFDEQWNLKKYNLRGKIAPKGFTLPKPKNLDKMFYIAHKLAASVGAPFLRVDLYNVQGKIYFGELTFYPDCGLDRHRLLDADLYFGSMIKV